MKEMQIVRKQNHYPQGMGIKMSHAKDSISWKLDFKIS
jgi:hypothetical protein